MLFDAIAFETVNSIHYRSSLHSLKDVCYIMFAVTFYCVWIWNILYSQWSCKEHLKQTAKHIEELGQPVLSYAIAMNLDIHTRTFTAWHQTAGHKRRLYAIFFQQKSPAWQCVYFLLFIFVVFWTIVHIRCAVEAMACGFLDHKSRCQWKTLLNPK